jgi:hypothetical protein
MGKQRHGTVFSSPRRLLRSTAAAGASLSKIVQQVCDDNHDPSFSLLSFRLVFSCLVL